MKKIIIILLALTLILTIMVACGDDDQKKNNTGSGNANASSVKELTSEELEAWGNVSIGLEAETQSNTQNTQSKTGTTSSFDKDYGYDPWLTLK